MQDSTVSHLLDAVAGEPGCKLLRSAMADRLRELGEPESVAQETFGPLPFSYWLNESRFCGSGSGSGIGIGIGSGSGGVNRMEVGKAYLVHCGDWHTICGRVVRQTGPFTYLLEKVSKIAETKGGDNWEKLAAGDRKARKAADYKHYNTHAVVPLNVLAFEWMGKLPQEETN